MTITPTSTQRLVAVRALPVSARLDILRGDERRAGTNAGVQLLRVHCTSPRCIGEQPHGRALADAIHLRPQTSDQPRELKRGSSGQ